MTFWILLLIIPIVIIAIVEELIYFFVNRNVFGPSSLELIITRWLKHAYKKLINLKDKRRMESK